MEKYFRTDNYKQSVYMTVKGKSKDISASLAMISTENQVKEGEKHTHISFIATSRIDCEAVGFRLGIDTYMDTYPEWNDKFFPTALRCEKEGFWGMFVSPLGKIITVACPGNIVSWKNEYNRSNYLMSDVGHRIYTSSIEFFNVHEQPLRHAKSAKEINANDKYEIDIYYKMVDSVQEGYEYITAKTGILFELPSRYIMQPKESITHKGEEITFDEVGRHIISEEGDAETSVYVRHDWFYYLENASKSAENCQQKAGSHVESWYGYFTRVAYAKILNNTEYTSQLVSEFEKFYKVITNRHGTLAKKALPHRIQNTSGFFELLLEFYSLTGDMKYMERANNNAEVLLKCQHADGSYRSHNIHYTCVIYPAKSMLMLAIKEREIGLLDRSKIHWDSARRAIYDLHKNKDNIGTEGQMTFEDGMISCEVLQLAFLAYNESKNREGLTSVAEEIFEKHKCLQQTIIPDCRTFGATLRFWEARYDINFRYNMLNTPHGWTSWKNCACYYLYMLTGKFEYLKLTMDTMGACMQVIDEQGVLNWAFVADPCIVGETFERGNDGHAVLVPTVVCEKYMPMISDWYRQDPEKLIFQYVLDFKKLKLKRSAGGSCDNDVHEHFKCLTETVFGRAFIHQCDDGKYELYNCYMKNDIFYSDDKHVKTYVIRAIKDGTINISNNNYSIIAGINEINI